MDGDTLVAAQSGPTAHREAASNIGFVSRVRTGPMPLDEERPYGWSRTASVANRPDGAKSMTKTDSTATLTDRDLDEIEAQMDETSPIYLPTLLRELRDARELIALLVEARR